MASPLFLRYTHGPAINTPPTGLITITPAPMTKLDQVRIYKTKDISEILDLLKTRYKGLTEPEIIKMCLSRVYCEEADL